ncbi:hypothetical protein QFZ30_004385 [Arthrobacter pascens]|uniref:hypothetical protein n=1 Tax=Arthrobacter pascens TaxID=1677 RepID=UPI0027911B74|nr:hypothetical protein [Arthrobacter pascens]MDQ0681003.1 hypothetical protein [Arthrobacter pascens]
MPINKKTLKDDGFAGFRTFGSLEIMRIPQGTGVFAVLQPEGFKPRFLKKSTAGIFKKKDPSIPGPALADEWVEDADILYFGKAGPGSKGNRGLRRQIQEFLDFGKGKPPGHWDGRLVWQLADSGSLLIAWKELPAEAVNDAEAKYHAEFHAVHDRLPFANLVQARVRN